MTPAGSGERDRRRLVPPASQGRGSAPGVCGFELQKSARLRPLVPRAEQARQTAAWRKSRAWFRSRRAERPTANLRGFITSLSVYL